LFVNEPFKYFNALVILLFKIKDFDFPFVRSSILKVVSKLRFLIIGKTLVENYMSEIFYQRKILLKKMQLE
jgi:hypothetical protein